MRTKSWELTSPSIISPVLIMIMTAFSVWLAGGSLEDVGVLFGLDVIFLCIIAVFLLELLESWKVHPFNIKNIINFIGLDWVDQNWTRSVHKPSDVGPLELILFVPLLQKNPVQIESFNKGMEISNGEFQLFCHLHQFTPLPNLLAFTFRHLPELVNVEGSLLG